MTTHARFEQLVAMGIDFGLTPADHNDLDDHLATCPTCRSLAAGYRTDTSGLREIARVEPPDRVRTAVLRAAARPAARTIEPWKLLVAAALLLTALMGAAAAIGAWNSRPTLVAVVPTTEPSAGSSAQPSASPVADVRTITIVGGVEADGPGETVSEAMANAGVEPRLVNGALLKEVDGTTWLCEAFPVSPPPQCVEPRLRVENSQPKPEGSPVEDNTFDAGPGVHEANGVRWVERVQLYGIVSAVVPSVVPSVPVADLPTPKCPAPPQQVVPPVVLATSGNGQKVAATPGSYTTMTCTTTGTADVVAKPPKESLAAYPGDTISFTVPVGWRFVRWEGSHTPLHGTGTGGVWLPTVLPDPSSSIELPDSPLLQDEIVSLTVVLVSDDGRAIIELGLQLEVNRNVS